jgi:hypothetical protein
MWREIRSRLVLELEWRVGMLHGLSVVLQLVWERRVGVLIRWSGTMN